MSLCTDNDAHSLPCCKGITAPGFVKLSIRLFQDNLGGAEDQHNKTVHMP